MNYVDIFESLARVNASVYEGVEIMHGLSGAYSTNSK
jgi:hypothetical protein